MLNKSTVYKAQCMIILRGSVVAVLQKIVSPSLRMSASKVRAVTASLKICHYLILPIQGFVCIEYVWDYYRLQSSIQQLLQLVLKNMEICRRVLLPIRLFWFKWLSRPLQCSSWPGHPGGPSCFVCSKSNIESSGTSLNILWIVLWPELMVFWKRDYF